MQVLYSENSRAQDPSLSMVNDVLELMIKLTQIDQGTEGLSIVDIIIESVDLGAMLAKFT